MLLVLNIYFWNCVITSQFFKHGTAYVTYKLRVIRVLLENLNYLCFGSTATLITCNVTRSQLDTRSFQCIMESVHCWLQSPLGHGGWNYSNDVSNAVFQILQVVRCGGVDPFLNHTPQPKIAWRKIGWTSWPWDRIEPHLPIQRFPNMRFG